jgi:nucleoside-diphosphate-sugar epimerase
MKEFGAGVKVFEGDLGDASSLEGFLTTGCTVINLAYLYDADEVTNRNYVRNLLSACREAKVARFVHCSTAAVVGRAPDDWVNEETPCQPVTDYGRTKLGIEDDIISYSRNYFEAIILRPTSVFGIGGEPLKKLVADITHGVGWKNYLKSCLFGRRRMNLVHVANVIAAIIFLIEYPKSLDGEIFIVSDDNHPQNNFYDVEQFLRGSLWVENYSMPRPLFPLFFLKFLLTLLGRNNVNPYCNFDSEKLRKLGFQSPMGFSEGLAEYSAWYRTTHLDG